MNTASSATAISGSVAPASYQGPYYPYGMQHYMGASGYHSGGLGSYPTYGGGYRFADAQTKSVAVRRNGEGDSAQLSRYANFPLEHYQGELYGLCKDQHGCRYLQRKLEERTPENVQMIFNEIVVHVVELMTGKTTSPTQVAC